MQPVPSVPLRRAAAALAGVGLLLASAPDLARAEVAAVPSEPGAVVLPVARTVAAIAGDIDGDGDRELVRMIRDADGATLVEAWRLVDAEWRASGSAVALPAPPSGGLDVYGDAGIRLLAFDDGARERVIVATQPRFELLDPGPACCLILHELVGTADGVELAPLREPMNSVASLIVADLDGDGVDELVTTGAGRRRIDGTRPVEAGLHRFVDGSFRDPVFTPLPALTVGPPFVLGDTDGRPGEEIGFIGQAITVGLYRLSIDDGDAVLLELAGVGPVDEAVGVVGLQGPAVVAKSGNSVSLLDWPSGGEATVLQATSVPTGRLMGALGEAEELQVLVVDVATGAIFALDERLRALNAIYQRTAAAGIMRTQGLRPYGGPVPGGGPRGPAFMINGRFIEADPPGPSRFEDLYTAPPVASLPGARPVGLVGDGSWMALENVGVGTPVPSRDGGLLEAAGPVPGLWTSIAPLADVLSPELADGDLRLPSMGQAIVRGDDVVVTGVAGFRTELAAPAGSRVFASGLDPSVIGSSPLVVPDDGLLTIPIRPPAVETPNPRFRPGLVVLTPAGHGYMASWDVQVLRDPPNVVLAASTPVLSPTIEVRGQTVPGAQVVVDGRAVAVAADGSFTAAVTLPPWPTRIAVEVVDPVGNVTRTEVVGIGVVDYRTLPWVPIVVVSVVVAGIVLYIRAPEPMPAAARDETDGDARLEEID